jgi:hypothetical protein
MRVAGTPCYALFFLFFGAGFVTGGSSAAASRSAASLAKRSAFSRALFAATASRSFSISFFTASSRCCGVMNALSARVRAASFELAKRLYFLLMSPSILRRAHRLRHGNRRTAMVVACMGKGPKWRKMHSPYA